ncbi:hypothetical protein BOX15_Mlig007910g1, partial [Macrostomum lignano]
YQLFMVRHYLRLKPPKLSGRLGMLKHDGSGEDADSCSSCRICLQSRDEIESSLAMFVADLLSSSSRLNSLVKLHCNCSVGSMRHICYRCLQKFDYESSRDGQCDVCHLRLFPSGSEPRRLLQAIFWLKCTSAAAAAILLLALASAALCRPGEPAFSAALAGGFASAGVLLVSLALAGLLAAQFRRGDLCPHGCGGGVGCCCCCCCCHEGEGSRLAEESNSRPLLRVTDSLMEPS